MFRLFFKMFFILVFLIAGYLAYGYYYYQKGEYQDLGIKYKSSDYNNAINNKLKIEIKDKNELFYGAKTKGTGEQKKEEFFTNEEITALVNFTNESKGSIKNFQIKFTGNNDYEAAFHYSNLKYRLFIPVYMKASLAYVGSNTVYFKFNDIYLGDYKLPKFLRERAANNFNLYINNCFGGLDVFEIDKLEINKDSISFKGLLPTKIEGYE
jgi:hypothetical protein